MIVIPTYLQYARLVAVDPGSNCMGVATIDFDCISRSIVATNAFTIHAKKSFVNDSFDESFGNRLARISAMSDVLANHYCTVKPNFAVCESPFIGMSQPQAYGALTETVCAVRSALATYDQYMPLYMVDPPSAKIGVGAAGNAKKDMMMMALVAIADSLNFVGGVQAISGLDEHSVDAVAIGYTVLQRIFNGYYA